jgi:hypothetical protein
MGSLLGPESPSVSALIDPTFAPTTHPASRVMVDIVLTFGNVLLPEKLGFLYIMHSTMRVSLRPTRPSHLPVPELISVQWMIAPDEENFERLPTWLKPTVSQVMFPHAAWIDNIPW